MNENKPQKLDEVLSESKLTDWLELPCNEGTGRSRVLGNWMKGGLRYAEKSGWRYFFEKDVIDYLWNRRNINDE